MHIMPLLTCWDCGWFISQGEFPPFNTPEQDDLLDQQANDLQPFIEDGWKVLYFADRFDEDEESTEPCQCCNTRLYGKRLILRAVVKDYSL